MSKKTKAALLQFYDEIAKDLEKVEKIFQEKEKTKMTTAVEKNGKKIRGANTDLVEALDAFEMTFDVEDYFEDPRSPKRFGVSDLHILLDVPRPKIRRWLIDGVIPGAKRDEKNRLYITRATFKRLCEKYSAQVKVETKTVSGLR